MLFTMSPFRVTKGALVVVPGKRVRSDVVVLLRDHAVGRALRWSVYRVDY